MSGPFSPYDCMVCEDVGIEGTNPLARAMLRTFIVCPNCGNKRCPKASWHENECTNSNDVGQAGSFYGPQEFWPKQETDR